METLVIKKENPIILNENPLFFNSYESLSTSEKAELKPIGDTSITVQNFPGVCQWSENNKRFHLLSGRKGLITIQANFQSVSDDYLIQEFITRVVLMRRHPLHQQYPINKICSLHRSSGNEDHVIQPAPCTNEEDFWYTNSGLHKSIIFRTPRPDQDGKISLQIKLISMCNDSCNFHTENFQKLINISGKEKSRDTCLVITLEARKHDELQTIARNHINMWIKANICPRDLEKKARRLPKGGAAQPSRCKKRKIVKCNRCGNIHDCNPSKKLP